MKALYLSFLTPQASIKQIVSDEGRVTGVELASGLVLPAQLVVAGIGAQCVRILKRPCMGTTDRPLRSGSKLTRFTHGQ